jgi:hypothetical protein
MKHPRDKGREDISIDELAEMEAKVLSEFNRAYPGLKELSFEITLLQKELGRAFMIAAGPPLSKDQADSFLYLLNTLIHQNLMGSLCMMRGHPTDATTFTRKAIEITAFMIEVLVNPESAERWINMAKSKGKRKDFLSRFQAWQVVTRQLPTRAQELVDAYEYYCLMVHPSLAAVSHQIEPDFSFDHIEFAHQGHHDHLVGQFLAALTNYVRMCEVLIEVCEEQKLIISSEYHKQHDIAQQKIAAANHQFVQNYEARRSK